MRKTKVFNGFGFAGQHGKASEMVLEIYEKKGDIEQLVEDTSLLELGLGTVVSDLTALTTLVNKLKALATVTVTFNTDGGSEVTAQTIPFGTVATLPEAPTKEGYTLDGWYLDDAPFDYETLVEANITLTARWTETVPEG